MGSCNVAPDSMSFVAVDAAFALLEMDRIARQVPVHQAMTPGVKVQSLLPDRGAGEQEGPERAVEGGANQVLADVLVVLRAQMAEAKSEHRAYSDFLRFDLIRIAGFKKPAVNPRSDGVNDLDERLRAFGCDRMSASAVLRPGMLFPQQMPLLIEHGLEIALAAILQDQPPIGRIVARRPSSRRKVGASAKSPRAG